MKYENGKIYKLCCKDANITDIYIGSTLDHYNRKRMHKNSCNNPNSHTYNYCVYQFIRDNGGFDNWDLVVLEEYAAENKNDLLWKEREWVERLKPSLNRWRPIITDEESNERRKKWTEANKEQIRERRKKYKEANKEQIREKDKIYKENNRQKRKDYYENNKEYILQKRKDYRKNNKDKIRNYRENNKERISNSNKERLKIWYINNREKVLEKNKTKVECKICNCMVSHSNFLRHTQSQKHIKNSKTPGESEEAKTIKRINFL